MSFQNDPQKMLKLLELAGKLKHLPRTGWVLRGVKKPEPVAGHMYRMGLMTMLLQDESGLNKTRCMEMALVHDLGESLIGDITPQCGVPRERKAAMELEAMQQLAQLAGLQGEAVLGLFKEFEEQETAESKFVKELDLFDMLLQAFEYEKCEESPGRLQEFIDVTKGKFSHPSVVSLVQQLYQDRSEHLKSKSS